jgi:hypothetical protein
MTTPQAPVGRPVPTPDAESQPFFDGAKARKLLLKYCAACSRWLAPASDTCDNCFTDKLEWRQASGKGEVYTFGIMHQVLHPGFKDEVPYNVIQVELAEGPRIMSNLVGTPNGQIKVGMKVEVIYEDLTPEVTVPKFKAV